MLVSSGQTEVLEQLKGECSALGTVPWRASGDAAQREQVADLHPRCPSFQLFRLTSVASTT